MTTPINKSGLLLLIALSMSVLSNSVSATPISVSYTGSAEENKWGYVAGESYTFTFVISESFEENYTCEFSDLENRWREETLTGSLFDDVFADGLTGSWRRPEASISYTRVWSNSQLATRVGSGWSDSLGLSAGGVEIRAIEAYTGNRDSGRFEYLGHYSDPVDYHTRITGIYDQVGGYTTLYGMNDDSLKFTNSSLSIQAIPEPMSASLLLLICPLLLIRRILWL